MNKEKLLQKIDSIKKSISKHLLRTSIFAVTAVFGAPVVIVILLRTRKEGI